MTSRFIVSESPAFLALNSALESGRMHHAYLLTGPEGSGKMALALHFAMALLCRDSGRKPCLTCASCRKIEDYSHPDFRIVFPFVSEEGFKDVAKDLDLKKEYQKKTGDDPTWEALYFYYLSRSAQEVVKAPFRKPGIAEMFEEKNRSITIDQIVPVIGGRDKNGALVTGEAETSPSESAVKVFLIADADRMNETVANRLLKTLEEPKAFIRFFLISAQRSALLPTVRSRCQELSFNGLNAADIRSFLAERESAPAGDADTAARFACGSMHNAYELLDDTDNAIKDGALDLLAWFIERNPKRALALAAAFSEETFPRNQKRLKFAMLFLQGLAEERRTGNTAFADTDFTARLKEITEGLSGELLTTVYDRFMIAYDALGRKVNPKLTLTALLLSFAD